MCGIGGFVSIPPATYATASDTIYRVTNRMRQRGPDAEGVWTGDGVVLGHRPLAILDLDARANQPMVSADGGYTVVFNGEIYNFRELRCALEVSRHGCFPGYVLPSQRTKRDWRHGSAVAQRPAPAKSEEPHGWVDRARHFGLCHRESRRWLQDFV
jgi:hypothetical protein